MRRLLLSLLCCAGTGTAASAAVFTYTDSTVTAIPDGTSSGVVRSLVVASGGESIVSVEIDLNVSAVTGDSAFLGDVYFYVTNGSEAAFLLNRPGSRTGAPGGYGDDQPLNVTFSASGPDIHTYRLTATGSHTAPLTGPLTGTWSADGRAADPAAVLDTSPRTAGLDIFNGDAADGTWSLFAADLSSGARHQINSWTLRVTTVPEPGAATLLLPALLALTARRRASC